MLVLTWVVALYKVLHSRLGSFSIVAGGGAELRDRGGPTHLCYWLAQAS